MISGLVAFYNIRPGNGSGLFFQPPEPTRHDSMDIKRFDVI